MAFSFIFFKEFFWLAGLHRFDLQLASKFRALPSKLGL
jgi:hypothetical protein